MRDNPKISLSRGMTFHQEYIKHDQIEGCLVEGGPRNGVVSCKGVPDEEFT